MLGYSDLKELASAIGIPATVVILAISSFELGIIPSLTSDIRTTVRSLHEKADLAGTEREQHNKEVGHLIRQHAEQMEILNRALKEICLNTAKNEIRSYKCAELDGTLRANQ